MSVFDELLAEFEQVAMARWLPLICPYTFRTVEEPLSGEEAALLLRANRIERGERPGALTDVDRRDLDAIAARLDALLASSFAPGPGGRRRCFAKLGDRSPKDQPVEWLRARQRAAFAARLRATSDSRAPNRALQAYVWAKGQSLVVSSGAEIVALILRSERAAMELETAVEVTPHPVRHLRLARLVPSPSRSCSSLILFSPSVPSLPGVDRASRVGGSGPGLRVPGLRVERPAHGTLSDGLDGRHPPLPTRASFFASASLVVSFLSSLRSHASPSSSLSAFLFLLSFLSFLFPLIPLFPPIFPPPLLPHFSSPPLSSSLSSLSIPSRRSLLGRRRLG